jgi:mannose-6-phosphate isomerase
MDITKLYPLKFAPVYKQILWGGSNIKRYFGRNTPYDKVAESWELCSRSDGMGIVDNGPLRGSSFESLIEEYKENLLGEKSVAHYGNTFPLLVKLIDANDRLSVQVHPDDAYARLEGEANGKNEMWYIVDAKEDAKLIYGLKEGVTKQKFSDAVSAGKIAETLREVPVKAGDSLFIPAGTVHAILSGILIAEIQQNSNTTYRIYDWGRVDANGKGRELHISKALDVINFGAAQGSGIAGELSAHEGFDSRALLRSQYFNLDEITVKTNYHGQTDSSFLAVINLRGSGMLTYDDGEMAIGAGETVLLPASLGKFTFTGSLKLLTTGL